MTEKRRFCLRGHDTAEVGRDVSGRCLQCKREPGRAARWARIATDHGIREAEQRRREEEEQAARDEAARRFYEEIDRRQEQKYQAAIKRGDYEAVMLAGTGRTASRSRRPATACVSGRTRSTDGTRGACATGARPASSATCTTASSSVRRPPSAKLRWKNPR